MIAVLRVFLYCKNCLDSKLVFDPYDKDFEDTDGFQGTRKGTYLKKMM